MRFLIHIPQLIFGGAEKVLVSFANDLVSRGHEVEILETYEKGFLKPQFDSRVAFDSICSNEFTAKYYASPEQISAAKNPFKKIFLVSKRVFCKIFGYRRMAERKAARKYKNREFDVAVNYLEIDSPKFILGSINAKKYVQWIHIDVANCNYIDEMDKLAAQMDNVNAIICVSETARKSFCERYPNLREKTELIYNFFDKQDIIKKSNEQFEYTGKRPFLLSVGRMTVQKGYVRFVEILLRLVSEGFDFEYHILGVGSELEQIEQKIKELGLEDRVFLDGVTDNPYKHMKNCDLFVLPSLWEGFPTVTVEAKTLGCAVMATRVAGVDEQVIHGETGYIVKNTEDAIFEGLKELLSNRELLEKIKNNSGMESILENEDKYQKFMNIIGE